jgi:hypothetical protein
MPGLMCAWRFQLGESRGTRHCMKAAERAGIPVIDYAERDQ